ncbi:hypothetical protein [Treponema sp.]|nr:hypothetical protein [Treponema sp.]
MNCNEYVIQVALEFYDEEKQKAISKEIADSLELRRLQREAKLKK